MWTPTAAAMLMPVAVAVRSQGRWTSVVVPRTMTTFPLAQLADGAAVRGELPEHGASYVVALLPGDHVHLAVRSATVPGLVAAMAALGSKDRRDAPEVVDHVAACGAAVAIRQFRYRKPRPGEFFPVDGAGRVGAPYAPKGPMATALAALVASGRDRDGVEVQEVLPPHPAAAPDRLVSGRCAFGLFASRDLPGGAPVALYDAGAIVTADGVANADCDRFPEDVVVLRDFEFEQPLHGSVVVFDGNPLVAAAARLNDASGTDSLPNTYMQGVLHVPPGGAPRLMVAAVTVEPVMRRSQLLLNYCGNYWDQRAGHMHKREAAESSLRLRLSLKELRPPALVL